MTAKTEVKVSNGNVFSDLELPSPDEALAKAQLSARIAERIARRCLSLAAAARILGIDEPMGSALLRGRVVEFSTERLRRFLAALG